MTHRHRFYSDTITADAAQVVLSGEEAHHALRVARLRAGDEVSVFNGAGLEVFGKLEQADKHTATVRVLQTVHHTPPRIRVTLAVGGLHRDKTQEEVVRRAAELGMRRVCFWDADHSQRPVKENARWQKSAIEACKQCGRFFLPEIDAAPSLDAFLNSHDGPCLIGLLADHAGAVAPTITVTDSLALIVGPEGDFSAREQALALDRGAIPMSLGAHTYRSEVAAALMMTLVAFELDELGPGIGFRV